tara:strand:- start:606 stop:1052 length:447 start_codon:yes stop_codon:yes gene_type:complete
MIEIVRLSEKDATYYWNAIEALVEKGLNKTDREYSVEDYKEYIECGYWELWIVIDTITSEIKGLGVTELIDYPNFSELLVRLVTGKDGKEWINLTTLENTFVDYATKNKCKRLIMYGRKGWLKILSKLSWTKGCTVMTRDIVTTEKGE